MEPHVRFEPNNKVRGTTSQRAGQRSIFSLIWLLALTLSSGCTNERLAQSGSPAPTANQHATPASSAPAAPRCDLPELPARYPAAPRVVAIGDLHGDLAATRAVLRLAGAIDDRDRWIGGKLILVQTGDILDRGDGEQAILDLFESLVGPARAAGGAVHVLNGNHELMNAALDFRYVTPGGFADFADVSGLDLEQAEVAALPEQKRARAAAFLPGGPYARLLAGHNTIVIIGDTVFVHGGVLPGYAGRDLVALNRQVRCWLAGEGARPALVNDESGPVWTTYLSVVPNCELLDKSLAKLGARRMVMGHHVQAAGVTSACDGRSFRIDTGLAALYNGHIEALEITPEGTRVLHGDRPEPQ